MITELVMLYLEHFGFAVLILAICNINLRCNLVMVKSKTFDLEKEMNDAMERLKKKSCLAYLMAYGQFRRPLGEEEEGGSCSQTEALARRRKAATRCEAQS